MQRIRKNDTVEIMAGKVRHLKVKRGRVIAVDKANNQVVVEGLNMVKRHTKANPQKSVKGGVLEKEAPLAISNVMPVCGACDKGVRVSFKMKDAGGKVRVCRSCGAEIG